MEQIVAKEASRESTETIAPFLTIFGVDTVNRFYQLLRLDYTSTANQRIKSCPTTFDQINLSQLLIKPLELKCGAFGSFNRELTKLLFARENVKDI